ncbi:MAG: response regulator, partial [Candidatus Margulisbacteria bacterium]|nr:response regulator [Candidatus Margulisiibacteriota bacterium]
MPQIKPNILVIDDEDSMLKAYKSILKNSYNLTLVNNPGEALDLLSGDNFSLIILDLKMPRMDGIEVLKKIKEIDDGLEVIMVTGVRDIKSAVQAIKLGAYDYVTKPFEAEELCSIIEKAMERRSLLRENVYLRQAI